MSNDGLHGADLPRPSDATDASAATRHVAGGRSLRLSDDQLRDIIASLNDEDLAPTPPPLRVWAQISAQISEADQPVEITANNDSTASSTDTDASLPHINRSKASPSQPDNHRTSRDWSTYRGRSLWLVAAAVVLVAIGGTWLISRRGSTERVVATAALRYEDTFDTAGVSAKATAELIEQDGTYRIALRDPDLPGELGEPADLELWLIQAKPDGSLDVQPVAIITRPDGTFTVPDGLDPTTHDIVDISIEPRDGDATHSGRSILRGTLVAA